MATGGGSGAAGGAASGAAGSGPGGVGGGTGGPHCVEEVVDQSCIGLGYTQRLFCPALTAPPWGCEPETSEATGSHYCCAPQYDTVIEAARCEEILLGDDVARAGYPPVYVPPENAAALYEAARAAFLDTHQLTSSDYVFKTSGLNYSLEIRAGSGDGSLVIGEDARDEAHTVPEIEAFLATAPSLFHYEGLRVNEGRTDCGVATRCRYEFTQDYCGFGVESTSGYYGGTLRVDLDPNTATVNLIFAHLVPMVPIYRNPVLSEQQIIDQVVGSTVSWICPQGTFEDRVPEDAGFTIDPLPRVLVRPTLDETKLEYRLVAEVGFFVSPGDFFAYVDVVDGTLIGPFAGFICG